MKVIQSFSRWMGYGAAVMLGVMMMLTFVDVFLRYLFNAPITGGIELSELIMVVVVFPALAWIALERRHIRVDMILIRLRPRAKLLLETVTYVLTLGMFVIITWQSFLEARQVDMKTSIMQLPEAPFHWIMGVGLMMFCIAIGSLLAENILALLKGGRDES